MPIRLLAVVFTDNDIDVVLAEGLTTNCLCKCVAATARVDNFSGCNSNDLEGVERERFVLVLKEYLLALQCTFRRSSMKCTYIVAPPNC